MNDSDFLKLSIEQSKLSVKQGRFPAGAVVVWDGKIIASETSDAYPGYQHAECRAIDNAFQKVGRLTNATLYASMEPCLMCLMRAYWSGIRRVVYVISRDKLNEQYYEGCNNLDIINNLNEAMQYLHIPDLEADALEIVKNWEKMYGY